MTPEEEAEIERLKRENAALREQLKAEQNTIKRAKDPNPIQRPGFKRVFKLVSEACMTLTKQPGGWLLTFGPLKRCFQRLRDIWEILLQDDWSLHGDIFPSTTTNPEKPPRLKGGFCNLSDRPSQPVPASKPVPKPKPAPLSVPASKPVAAASAPTPKFGTAEIEVLRAEWRMFPSSRQAIEEQAAKYDIQLFPA